MILSIIIFVLFIGQYIWVKLNVKSDLGFCHRPEFIMTDCMMLFVMILFILLGLKVTNEIWKLVTEVEGIFGKDNQKKSSKYNYETKILLESRKASVKIMWLIIGFMLFSVIFDLVYSIMYKRMTSTECYPTRISTMLDSFFKGCDRFIYNIIWFYPIIWAFWPTKK